MEACVTNETAVTSVLPRPAPGTVARATPPPRPVEEALRLVDEGEKPAEVSRRLAGSFGVEDLRAAQIWWVRRMPKVRWNDHRAGAVLRALEEAVKHLDPKLPSAS